MPNATLFSVFGVEIVANSPPTTTNIPQQTPQKVCYIGKNVLFLQHEWV